MTIIYAKSRPYQLNFLVIGMRDVNKLCQRCIITPANTESDEGVLNYMYLPGLQGNFLSFPSVVHELLHFHSGHDNTAIGIKFETVQTVKN
jgi:hypothetical protein